MAAVSSREVEISCRLQKRTVVVGDVSEWYPCRWHQGVHVTHQMPGDFSEPGRFGTAASSIDGRRANQASGFRGGSAAALVAERQKLPRAFFDQLQTGPTLSQGHAATRP